MSYDEVKR